MNNVSIIGFRSPSPRYPKPGLSLAVAKRLDLFNDEATWALQDACPIDPVTVPCLPEESPADLGTLLSSLGAIIRPVD